jgi:hypothetical protein
MPSRQKQKQLNAKHFGNNYGKGNHMAEPSTAVIAIATATGVSLASVVFGLNADTAIGSFAGATLFITSTHELTIKTRILYLIISVVMGYFVAGEILQNTFIASPGVAGFIGGLTSISVSLLIIKQLQDGDLIGLISSLRGKK